LETLKFTKFTCPKDENKFYSERAKMWNKCYARIKFNFNVQPIFRRKKTKYCFGK